MKILIVGSGGREHALAWKLSQSPRQPELYVAPGNVGMMSLATCVDIEVSDLEGLLAFAQNQEIDMTVVGPELPLVMGIVDAFEQVGLKIIGPNQKAAQFEGSKGFTKEFLQKYNIPTAAYARCSSYQQAMEALKGFHLPLVIKADGLAAGKGVVIANTLDEAKETLFDMMENKQFGDACDQVVIETFLKGIEASVLCFSDGETLLPMEVAQDYKKAFDGDCGLNTGGMGAYCPSLVVDDALLVKIKNRVLQPFLQGIKSEGIDYKGILFVGLMIHGEEINVLEYNVRFGDPETEVVLPRLKNDLIDVFEAILEKRLSTMRLDWLDMHTACVVMASGGYPEKYQVGFPIEGINRCEDVMVFHAGTRMEKGEIVTNGGRVLCVTAIDNSHEKALKKAYACVDKIKFQGMHFRNDIGK